MLWSELGSLQSSPEAFWDSRGHLILASCDMSTLALFHSVRDDMLTPCCPHWHDWLTTLLPYYPVSQLCLKGLEPSFQIRGVTTNVNFSLQTSYRNWSSPWWSCPPAFDHTAKEPVPSLWSLAAHRAFLWVPFSNVWHRVLVKGSALLCGAIGAVSACLLQCAGSEGVYATRPLTFLAISSVLHSKSSFPFLA